MWKKFGCHKVRKHLGPVGVEFCCIFSIFTRAPLAFAFGKSSTSDEYLFTRLVKHVRKGTVVLLDNGFYSFSIFELILKWSSHFIIPASVSLRSKFVEQLGDGDYLAEIAALYHLRWTVETFYREFKISMQANVWHCQKVDSFEKELVSKLIAAFHCEFIRRCARYLVDIRPDRAFSRDKQITGGNPGTCRKREQADLRLKLTSRKIQGRRCSLRKTEPYSS